MKTNDCQHAEKIKGMRRGEKKRRKSQLEYEYSEALRPVPQNHIVLEKMADPMGRERGEERGRGGKKGERRNIL